ncbi:uncharacterized protein LOC143148253 [Ptiloglossa arizonensis]|uniref:uncharacterized protein LOC143148253 n=1 Tax=Ptiloglossa arizonensis TaxID=3350558 RepID=UPI003FA04DA8
MAAGDNVKDTWRLTKSLLAHLVRMNFDRSSNRYFFYSHSMYEEDKESRKGKGKVRIGIASNLISLETAAHGFILRTGIHAVRLTASVCKRIHGPLKGDSTRVAR